MLFHQRGAGVGSFPVPFYEENDDPLDNSAVTFPSFLALNVHTIHHTFILNAIFICPYVSFIQVGPDSMVGSGSSIGEKVSIKKSTIGQHCVIKDRVKITNSVVMDHVTIHEGYVSNPPCSVAMVTFLMYDR